MGPDHEKHFRIEVEVDGKPKSLKLRYLNVWVKQAGAWKFVAWQSTSIPA